MKLIIDIGGTRGRWYIVDKSIISFFETEGFKTNIQAGKDYFHLEEIVG